MGDRLSFMDPLSQALWGASLAQTGSTKTFFKNKKKLLALTLIGALSGMSPDLDVLFFSKGDPLFSLIFHRHFTHSLFFVPFGALLCAIVFYKLFKSLSFKEIYYFSFLGILTHGILDSATSYGTLWLWPFYTERISWNIIPIIDGFFTLPLLFFVIFSVRKKSLKLARAGLLVSFLVLGFGFYQKKKVENIILQEAQKRGHVIESIYIRPASFHLFHWRAIYEHQDKFFVQGLKKLFPFQKHELLEVNSIVKLNPKKHLKFLHHFSPQYKDLKNFSWFTQGLIGFNPKKPYFLGDLRYGITPSSLTSMWGIRFNPQNPKKHVSLERSFRRSLKALKSPPHTGL